MSLPLTFNLVSDMCELWLNGKNRRAYKSANIELVNALYLIHLEQAEQEGYLPIDPFDFSISMLNLMKDSKEKNQSWDIFKRLVTNELENIHNKKKLTKTKKTA